MKVSGGDDILTFAINRGRMGGSPHARLQNDGGHPLRCRELSPANSGDDFFMRQVAKVDLRGLC